MQKILPLLRIGNLTVPTVCITGVHHCQAREVFKNLFDIAMNELKAAAKEGKEPGEECDEPAKSLALRSR